MRRVALLSSIALGLFACADDEVSMASAGEDGTTSAAEDGTGGGPSGPDASAGGTAADDTADGGSDAGDETGDPVDLPPPPATGIQIVEVTVDQGIRVPIARIGELVGPQKRNLPVLQQRPGVFRAFYEVDPGFATRTLYGVMTVHQTDGTTTTYDSFVQASEEACDQTWIYECRYGSPTGSLVWRVPAEAMRPGMEYSIELLETAPGHEDDVSDKSPIFPVTGGSMIVGVEDTYMKMRVVVVPFDHALGPDCADPPDLLAEFGTDYEGNPRTIADYFGERLYAHNPVDEVEIIVHDTVSFTGSMQGSQLLFELAQMRAAEGAPPEYYYYGVARPCDGGPDFSGVAQLGGPFQEEASSRVGWGVFHASVSSTANTFVHEIGHEQGRQHIACSGEEGGPDASYPDHPQGDTESWGIDIMANPVSIQPPTSHDYMTYCGSTWVSEWAYDKVLPWIEELSSWERSASPPPPQMLLHGRVAEDGTSQWFVAPGWFRDSEVTADHVVRLYAGSELRAERGVIVREYEKSGDLEVIAAIDPAQWADIDALELVAPLSRVEFDRDDVVVLETVPATISRP
jgi:hypothetical protein